MIQGLRLWLSRDLKMNPSKIQFCEMNLPIYQVRCPQQTDHVSCGYFVFRNIISLLNKANDIFPIKIEDLLLDCTSKAKYIEYLKNNKKSEKNKAIRKIEKEPMMMYSPTSVQVSFRKEVNELFVRLHYLYDECLEKEKELNTMVADHNKIKSDIKSALEESMRIDKSNKLNSVLKESKKTQGTLKKELDYFSELQDQTYI